MIKVGQGPGELPDGYVGNLSDFIIVKNKVIAFSSYKAMWFNEQGEFQEEKRLPTKGRANFIVTPDLNYYVFDSEISNEDRGRIITEKKIFNPFFSSLKTWLIISHHGWWENLYRDARYAAPTKKLNSYPLNWQICLEDIN